jgi:hypothetical protein
MGGGNGPGVGRLSDWELSRYNQWSLEFVVALFGSPNSVPRRVYQFRERVEPSCG